MNPQVIRENLRTHKGERVSIQVFGMRNKTDKFIGTLEEIYPQIFTVVIGDSIKSFSYFELINGEVVISFI